jgi:hypothetical protein
MGASEGRGAGYSVGFGFATIQPLLDQVATGILRGPDRTAVRGILRTHENVQVELPRDL